MAKYTDTPLPLIPTPAHQTGKTDIFTLSASQMALVHNAILRGYNSIYQQAPLLHPHDIPDFINYALSWCEMVYGHHRGEEEVLFPLLEEGAGVKGLMDRDKNEHEAFYAGLGEMKTYLEDCLRASNLATAFNGTRLTALMDAFGAPLHSHLSNEPGHLASLSAYPGIDMPSIVAATEKDAMDHASPLYMLPMLLFNLDVEFEGGQWRDFPVSGWTRWGLVNVAGWWRGNWWRFASVGRDGQRRELLACREGYWVLYDARWSGRDGIKKSPVR